MVRNASPGRYLSGGPDIRFEFYARASRMRGTRELRTATLARPLAQNTTTDRLESSLYSL
jgi:hypothetical protein